MVRRLGNLLLNGRRRPRETAGKPARYTDADLTLTAAIPPVTIPNSRFSRHPGGEHFRSYMATWENSQGQPDEKMAREPAPRYASSSCCSATLHWITDSTHWKKLSTHLTRKW